MSTGKCPSCKQPVTVVEGHAVTINVGGGEFRGVTYTCTNPDCQAVIGCEIDPLSTKHEIVKEIEELLQKHGVGQD